MTTPAPPVLDAPPPPPYRADPVNFSIRADAFLGWFPTAWTQLTAALAWITLRLNEVLASAQQVSTDTSLAQASAASAAANAAAANAAAGQASIITSVVSSAIPTVHTFSGTGAATTFTLPFGPQSKNMVDVFVGGQRVALSGFSLVGPTVTLVTPPPVGTNNVDSKVGASTSLSYTPAIDYGLITSSPTSSADYGAIL
jgi:hypothetical protein